MSDAAAARCVAVTKRFGGTVALRDVTLVVPRGGIHGFVGENGAGKSTCFGLFSGRYAPTSGTVDIFGRALTGRGPREAQAAGVAAIYQEVQVVPQLSAVANAFLGLEHVSRAHFLNRRVMRERFGEWTERLGVRIPAGARAGELSLAAAQVIEIIRALVSGAELVMFDEPTTALSAEDRESLYRVMRSLADQGLTQLFVSHNLDEVLALCDNVTVFRDGRVVESRPAGDWSKRELVTAMVGHPPSTHQEASRSRNTGVGRRVPSIAVRDLQIRGKGWKVPISAHPGEIVGLAGLTGSGRTSILRAIAGADPYSSGALEINGAPTAWPHRVSQARSVGIALLPEDRKTQGLVLGASVIDSLLLGGYAKVARHGLLRRRRSRSAATASALAAKIDPKRIDSRVDTLSGGNQQKVLVARWIQSQPSVLLCDEPTRGVDVVARSEIWESLRRLAAAGMALIVVSSELEELTDHCHRLLVIADHEIVDEVDVADGITPQTLLRTIFEHARGDMSAEEV